MRQVDTIDNCICYSPQILQTSSAESYERDLSRKFKVGRHIILLMSQNFHLLTDIEVNVNINQIVVFRIK